MHKELAPLEELEVIKSFQNKRIFDVTYDNGIQKHFEIKTIGELFPNEINKIETALKDYELLKERTKLDSFECLLRLEEILPRGKELLIPVAKQLKALEIIEKTWGSRILNDIQDGFVLGSPFTVLPPKEDCEFLKEVFKK